MENLTIQNDRIRAHSPPEANQRIDEQIANNLKLYATADKEQITRRLQELDREWDIERVLMTNGSSVILGGLLLGFLSNRKWMMLSMTAGGFLLQLAIQGWCPPLTIFRNRGVRTLNEINRERYGLKLLRGDFDSYHSGEKPNIEEVLSLVDRTA